MRGGMSILFGTVIAFILLFLYLGTVAWLVVETIAYWHEHCGQVALTQNVCQAPTDPLVPEGTIYVATTVGGLVSALVIAVLSVTRPGATPAIAGVALRSRSQETWTNRIAGVYLFIWIVTGLAALLVGVMIYPGIQPTLSDMGTTWLGLAVSATYAYFGLNPPSSGSSVSALSSVEHSTGDLTEGQRVPNTSERESSGPLVKKIRREDPEFSQLVTNQNALIVFKDEEGTGADRLMSRRLMEKLDTLAAAVANEWSGVKLRVTEAWDEDDEHVATSLHYEGRAADLTTSPRDGEKLGRLGRLAVEAGFDWVYFEDSSHIHVSVRA